MRASVIAVVVAVVAVVGLAGCSREAPTRPAPPVDNRGGAAAAAPVDAAPVDGPDSACVAACVRDRQMVAMSLAAIREACRRDCSSPPPP